MAPWKAMDRPPRSIDRIAADLRALGLRPGALVMVHASLRRVGPVEGGADGLIDAIRAAIGAEGTMMMVLGAEDGHAWVNERPEPERAALLADAEPFDARTTPAAPDVGALAEVFRQRPETVVSDHPEARFGAAGPLARALLAEVPWDDYFGRGSPLERLVEDGGVVLRLGADLNTVTVLHNAEYRCSIEPKRRVRRHRRITTPAGPAIRAVECLDDEEGIVDYPGEDYFEDLLRDYLATGRAVSSPVGDARSELLDAADVVAFGVDWMERHLATRAWSVDPGTIGRQLDADLLAARRRRSGAEIAALRSLKTALANVEAVPVPERPYELVEGSADVPRRVLATDDVGAVIAAEIGERSRAIERYRGLGLDTAALELELETIERYRIA
jgi:aminoglycoside N3'-acetyltransferase